MKQLAQGLMQNDLFVVMMSGLFAYTAMMAVIISVLQVPPEAILDSGLDQVMMVFEEFPDD